MSIENIAMSKDGREIWFECYVNDEQMVEQEPKVKEHLDSRREIHQSFWKLNEKINKN